MKKLSTSILQTFVGDEWGTILTDSKIGYCNSQDETVY